jgi:CheY-like chemotaxis protein
MGGEIGCAVWSMGDRDAGNEFWLILPVKPLPDGLRSGVPQTEAQPRRALPRTRILLVEDILANQLVTATQLRREGHLVDIASSGPEAISAASSRPYDLILMDIFMPGMDGLETTQRIRGLGGPAAHVPILALTASVDAESEAQCFGAGMSGMLGKPVALPDLLDAIARYVWPYRSDPQSAETATGAEFSGKAPDILSANRLDELRATLPADTLAGLVEECLVELSERVGLLQDALRQGAAEAIFAQAHAMAGMSAEYGMAALELRLRTLMRALRGQPDAAAAIGEELEVDVARAAEALREALRIEMV